jgi:ribose transport system substrate-binding protein
MSLKLSRCIHLAGLACALSACGSDDSAAPKKTVTRVEIPESEFKPVELENTVNTLVGEIQKTSAKQLQLGVVLKENSNYWESVKIGANRAFGELGVSGVVLAPTESTEEEARNEQVALLQEREGTGYDGLGLAPLADILTPEINNFADAGVPVVTIDSDLPDSERQLYIGTINYEAGHTSAETLTSMLDGKMGSVIVLGHADQPTWPDGYNRTQGATDVLTSAGYNVIVRQTSWTTDGEQEDVDFMTDAITTTDPPVVGMLSMFSPTFRCARSVTAAGLTGDDVTIVGFDFEPETVTDMQSGLIKATHAQRQYYFGYMLPYVLYSMKVLGMDKTRDILAPEMVDEHSFNAGIDVVRNDQVDEYNTYLDSLGIGG